ncbi:MBL fold metallo-hydrolase [Synergistales bacterium]|nr:MBL fold metallo-hydrolase [Synergistales bacterium]
MLIMNNLDAKLPDGLHLFDLPQTMEGFRSFISSWFFKDDAGRRIVVDPGPASSADALIEKLSGVTDGVDIVLITHIHLDHSGGIGQFVKRAGSRVMAHPKARKHLTDPAKLWESSLAVLGDTARMYGPPEPLPESALISADELPGIGIIDTIGHSPHHLAYFVPFRGGRLAFIGESCGVNSSFGATDEYPYIRPATPPRFEPEHFMSSMDRVYNALEGGELLCYGHYGAARNAKERVAMAKEQLERWVSAISGMADTPEDEIITKLLNSDPLTRGFNDMPEDIRNRERIFIRNSVRGILKYCKGE